MHKKVWSWYKEKFFKKDGPLYKKVIGVLIFVFILAAIIVVLFLKTREDKDESDKAHDEMVDDVLDNLEENREEIKDAISEKKKLIVTKLNQASTIDKKTVEQREKIMNAKTPEELDKLQEEFGL